MEKEAVEKMVVEKRKELNTLMKQLRKDTIENATSVQAEEREMKWYQITMDLVELEDTLFKMKKGK